MGMLQKNKWPGCYSATCIFRKHPCCRNWMRQMDWLLPFAIISRRIIRYRKRNILDGRTLLQRIRAKSVETKKDACNYRHPLLIDTLLYVCWIHSDLYDSLCHHSFGYFHEACNVRTFHIVDILILFSVFDTLLVDSAHDLMQFVIDFGSCPRNMHGILSHF